MARAIVPIPRPLFRSLFSLLLVPFLVSPSLCEEPLFIRPDVEQVRSPWPGLDRRILKRPRIGLVLSGGGARGIAQIGVLKALERLEVPIDFIAATSLGAVVGGLYASGYTCAELESIAVSTNWDEVLSLTEDTKRTDLFVEQKMEDDRTFLSLRFQGFEPVLPTAVSSGQRLTNFLNSLTFRAIYQPAESFDDLRIPFRAVSTDLVSGRRVILERGSLAEALRASSTVPLLFTPVEKDSLRLVDGGLVSNIPVDVAREEGCDLVIAVNTTSGMRTETYLGAPWQTADQIMGIMMQSSNREQLRMADVKIVPDLGDHLSSDFDNVGELIRLGECAAEVVMEEFLRHYEPDILASTVDTATFSGTVSVEHEGHWPEHHAWSLLWEEIRNRSTSAAHVRDNLNTLFAAGLEGVYAEVHRGNTRTRVVYALKGSIVVQRVRFEGNSLIGTDTLEATCSSLIGKPLAFDAVSESLESILRIYRHAGLSLARIEKVSADSTGMLLIGLTEGVIKKIWIEGAERTRDYVVLREFPIHEGDAFRIDQASRGLENINGTTLFEYAQLDVEYPDDKPELTIRLKERPSQLLSFGLRIDNERNLQGLLELRDDNIEGTGSSGGFSISGGGRNQEFVLDFHAHRLFDSYFSFKTALFHKSFDYFLYSDAQETDPGSWEREENGEYRTQRYGGQLELGTQLEKIGNVHAGLSVERVQTSSRRDAEELEEEYDLAKLEFGTVIDSKDRYPFPTSGVGMDISFGFAFEGLGGDVQYNALQGMYESFHSWGGVHTIHPMITLGLADKTMPFAEQFRLGGLETMFGLREGDTRGRQLLLLNVEYRWQFPFQVLFDTYLQVRYDLGNISDVPEEIKFSTFRHGVGIAVSLDTPIGAASIAMGKSFYFIDDPTYPLQQGPLLLYFMIGYPLWLPSPAMPH